MANLVNNTFEYTVKHTPGWFAEALLEPQILRGNYFRVEPRVTDEVLFKKLTHSVTSISQKDDRSCSWDPIDVFGTDGKTVKVNNYKINHEQCLDDLDSIYSENVFAGMGGPAGANKLELPNYDGYADVMMGELRKMLGYDIDRIIIGGSTDNHVSGIAEGILDQAATDDKVIKVAGTAITDDNVVDEVAKLYKAIPAPLLHTRFYNVDRGILRIFVAPNVYEAILDILPSMWSNDLVVWQHWQYNNATGAIRYRNIEIVVLTVLPADTMFAAQKDNLVFATDLLSDVSDGFKVQRGQDLPHENTLYVKGQYRAKASYIYGQELVVYSK